MTNKNQKTKLSHGPKRPRQSRQQPHAARKDCDSKEIDTLPQRPHQQLPTVAQPGDGRDNKPKATRGLERPHQPKIKLLRGPERPRPQNNSCTRPERTATTNKSTCGLEGRANESKLSHGPIKAATTNKSTRGLERPRQPKTRLSRGPKRPRQQNNSGVWPGRTAMTTNRCVASRPCQQIQNGHAAP